MVNIAKSTVRGLDAVQYIVGPITFQVEAKNQDGEALISGICYKWSHSHLTANTQEESSLIQSFKDQRDQLLPVSKFDSIVQRLTCKDIYDKLDGTYDVTFVPKFAGIHKIWVRDKKQQTKY